jgi:hypothetical protein
MKKTTLALAFCALALAGCGRDDAIKPMAMGPQQSADGSPIAPAQQMQPQQQAHSDNSWIWGAGLGYLLGRSTAPQAQAPQYAPAAPAYQAPRRSWWSDMKSRRQDTAVAAPKPTPAPQPATPTPAPVKPPVLSTSPNTFTVPKPTVAPSPSFSGPSSYKAPTYSFKPSSPSRSFSSGRR